MSDGKVTYTDAQTFAWIMGERGPQPVIWNDDFALPYSKGRTILFSKNMDKDDENKTLDELAVMYPCPVNA